MARIPDEMIEQVRDAADLLEIVQEQVPLKRTGSDWRGPCPFHGGTGRNFAVIPKKNSYYCFVCHVGGDVFTWYRERFGMDYPTAVREVARRYGIPIPESTERAGPDPREPLFQACDAAQGWFAAQLRDNAEAETARRYLLQREFSLDAAATLGLGYAPRGNEFVAAMKQLGIAEDVLDRGGARRAARRRHGRPALSRPAALSDSRPARPRGRLRRADPRLGGAQVSQLARRRRSFTRASSSTTCTSPRRHPQGGVRDPGRRVLRRAAPGARRHRTRRRAARHRVHRSAGHAAQALHQRSGPAVRQRRTGTEGDLPRRRRAAGARRARSRRDAAAGRRSRHAGHSVAAPRPSSRCSATRWTCSSASCSCSTPRDGSATCAGRARRSIGCCRRCVRRATR